MKRFAPLLMALMICTALPTFAYAVELGGLDATAGQAGIKDTSATPQAVVGRVLAQGISLVGIIFFALILWAGFLWMTAAGNEQRVDEAKQILLAAVIGLIIVAAAYAITKFVGSTLLTGNSSV